MKKFLALILSLVCVFALAFTACGEQPNNNIGGNNNEQTGDQGNENNDPNGGNEGNENNDPNGGNQGNENNEPHTHTYETGWSYDSQTHWHAATCHPEEKKNEAPHVYEEGECIVCHKSETYNVGDKLPDFTVDTYSNNVYSEGTFSSADVRGKVLVINFWYVTCGICVEEMPDIEKVRASFGDKVVVLALHIDNGEQSGGQAFLSKNDPNGSPKKVPWVDYGTIFAKDLSGSTIFNWFSGVMCPMTVVVNGAGVVTAKMQGNMFPFDWDTYVYGDNLTPAIEEAMASYSADPETPENPDDGKQEPETPENPDDGKQEPETPENPDDGKQDPENPETPENPDDGKQDPEVPENPNEGDKDKEEEQPHECTYSKYWSCNENYHWHASTCSEHPEKRDAYAPHNYVSGRCSECKVSSSGTYNVGDRIPDFTLETFNSAYKEGTFSSEDARGKVMVINFWYTTCGICADEMPDIEKVRKNFGDDVVVLGIHLNQGSYVSELTKAQSFIQSKGWGNYGIIFGKDLSNGKLFNGCGGKLCPFTVILNGEGIVTAKLQGNMFPFDMETFKYGDNLTPAINKAMGK